MANIKIKDQTVNIWGLQPEMQPVLKFASQIWQLHGYDFVVTSARDGMHSPGSYHYFGYAVDFRTWGSDGAQLKQEAKQQLAAELKARLNTLSNYFDIHIHTSHIHVEYDWMRSRTSNVPGSRLT